MNTISVDLPDDLKSYVDESARQGGFANAGEYIAALVAAASRNRSDLETALLAGLSSSDARPWTSEEWQAIKERVASRGSE